MALLVDTGILYAFFDRTDSWFERARNFLATNREPLLVPQTVLPEVAHLLRKRGGPDVERKLAAAIATRELTTAALEEADFVRILELMDDYPPIGFVDASVVALAERLDIRRVLTTDRRHFSMIRPRHVEALELVP